MGQRFLIDTNVLIDYYAGKIPIKGMIFIKEYLNDSFNISIIVKIETLGFNGIEEDMIGLEALIRLSNIIYIDENISETTIQVRKSISKIKLGDAIIAATALANNFTLISRNLKDFKNIQGLTVINSYDI